MKLEFWTDSTFGYLLTWMVEGETLCGWSSETICTDTSRTWEEHDFVRWGDGGNHPATATSEYGCQLLHAHMTISVINGTFVGNTRVTFVFFAIISCRNIAFSSSGVLTCRWPLCSVQRSVHSTHKTGVAPSNEVASKPASMTSFH